MNRRTRVLLVVLAVIGLGALLLRSLDEPGGERLALPPTDYAEAEAPPQFGDPIRLVEVASLGVSVTDITHAGDGTGRLFIAGKEGVIYLLEGGIVRPKPFADLRDRVSADALERGLLGLAFSNDFENSGDFYVNYTGAEGATFVSRFSSDGELADLASEVVLLKLDQPYSNHNGGQLQFGPDGYLYVATGDGGAAGDPLENAENPNTLLGALLRIDVAAPEAERPYAIPADNPFATDGGAPEVWAYGLRNPWRFSFDDSGMLWIADVGQSWYEEVNWVDPAESAGANFGWDIMEGAHCFEPTEGCDESGLVAPAYEYDHGQGCSITGGVVVGAGGPERLDGFYLFTDYCGGWIRGLRRSGRGLEAFTLLPATDEPLALVAFGAGEDGVVYVLNLSGVVYRIEG